MILGGYKNETEKLLNFNPGMPSRFPTTINFIEYSTDTLLSIFYKSINSRRIDIYPGSETEIRLLIEKSKRRNLVDSVVINYKSRISELPEEEDIDTAITEDDLKEV